MTTKPLYKYIIAIRMPGDMPGEEQLEAVYANDLQEALDKAEEAYPDNISLTQRDVTPNEEEE